MSFFSYLRKVLFANMGLSGLTVAQHREIYDEWRRMVASKKYPLDIQLPWITIFASNYLRDSLTQQTGKARIFEFGTGGSSAFFLKFAAELVSVEHDKEWFEMVKKRITELGHASKWTGSFIEAEKLSGDVAGLDIANPAHYYSDDDKFKKHSFKNYASSIDKYPDEYFDLVLVDGRSRPSCVAHSVPKVKRGGLLVLDNAERKYYTQQQPGLKNFTLVVSHMGALVCDDQFSQTNVYRKV